MSGQTVTKASMSKRLRGLIAGTQKHVSSGQLTFGNTTYAVPALVQLLGRLADAIDATDAARARWQDALKDAVVTHAQLAPVATGYQAWVAATYAGAPSTLADFGMTPRKERTPLTVEQKAAAAAKRVATRKARHTMGKVQKKNVKGTVSTTAPSTQPPAAATPVATPHAS